MGVKDIKHSLLNDVTWKVYFQTLVAWFNGECIVRYWLNLARWLRFGHFYKDGPCNMFHVFRWAIKA